MTLPTQKRSSEIQSIFKSLGNRLFNPHPSLKEISKRRKAQLTAILSFILSVALGVGLFFGPKAVATFISLLTIALLSYFLSRTKYYLISAFLLSDQLGHSEYCSR